MNTNCIYDLAGFDDVEAGAVAIPIIDMQSLEIDKCNIMFFTGIDLWTFAHEVGHCLGFDHNHDVDSVMSYYTSGDEPTDFDFYGLQYLYPKTLKVQSHE